MAQKAGKLTSLDAKGLSLLNTILDSLLTSIDEKNLSPAAEIPMANLRIKPLGIVTVRPSSAGTFITHGLGVAPTFVSVLPMENRAVWLLQTPDKEKIVLRCTTPAMKCLVVVGA